MDLLDMARLSDTLPRHRALVGIQPGNLDWGDDPSPPVAAAVGGPGRLIRDGVDGRLVPPDRPDRLAAVLHELVCHPQVIRDLGARGARRFRREWTWNTLFPRWSDLFRETMA